ncbi:MAG: hypothetical protein M3530_12080 [Thermoproteota archaeon]|nr:hypothetical protein [Thermoproteota archaeon]
MSITVISNESEKIIAAGSWRLRDMAVGLPTGRSQNINVQLARNVTKPGFTFSLSTSTMGITF